MQPTHGVPTAPTSPDEPSGAAAAETEVSAMVVSHRSSHYWFWFLIFGVIPLIEVIRHGYGANPQTYEAFWLLGTGLLGLLVANKNLNDGQLAKPYDVLVGLVFMFAGVIGIAGDLGAHTGSISTAIEHVGLSLDGLYPLVYTFLGLKSLHHGLGKKG